MTRLAVLRRLFSAGDHSRKKSANDGNQRKTRPLSKAARSKRKKTTRRRIRGGTRADVEGRRVMRRRKGIVPW